MTDLSGRSSGRPTSAESDEIERMLLSAAFDEFVEHGYAGASLTRIVARAHMSKTTLYSRYPAKGALFEDVVRQQIDFDRPYHSLYAASGRPDVAAGLERFAIEMLNFSFEARIFALNRVIMAEVHRIPELAQAAEEKMQRGIDRITRYLQAHADEQGRPIADADGIAEAFIHMIRGWYLHRLMGTRTTTDAEVRVGAAKAVRALIRPGPDW